MNPTSFARLMTCAVVLLVAACSDGLPRYGHRTEATGTPTATAGATSPPPEPAPTATETLVPGSPADGSPENVRSAVEILTDRFFEPVDEATLYGDAWDGAVAALQRAGAGAVPARPDFSGTPADTFFSNYTRLEESARGRMSRQELLTAALRALVRQRRDCHTSYVPADIVRGNARQPDTEGTVTLGLGFAPDAPVRVASLLPGGPAREAGLRHGHRVTMINGRSTDGLTGAEADALLDQRAGMPNRLAIAGSDGAVREVLVTAAPARTPVEEHELLPSGVGIIRFYTFSNSVELARRIRAALEGFEAQGARGWIIDLRDNSGGSVITAVAIASLFVQRGRLYEVVPRDTLSTVVQADGSALDVQRPLVFLVGPGSGSAAEIVPGALQSLGRALLVGEQTYGCIGYARILPLPDRSLLGVTEAAVLIGEQRKRLNGAGITPDLVVPRTPEDEEAGRDPQLDAAVRLITGRAGR